MARLYQNGDSLNFNPDPHATDVTQRSCRPGGIDPGGGGLRGGATRRGRQVGAPIETVLKQTVGQRKE